MSDVDDYSMQGLSEADMSALDGIWTTVSGEPIEEPALDRLDVPVRPGLEEPRGVSLADAKGAVEDEDSAGVFPWRSGSVAEIQAQWPDLRAFVEWAVRVYRLGEAEHAACWWRHPEVVSEWVAIRHLYDLSWNRDDSGGGPSNFHYWLDVSRARLARYWTTNSRCRQGGHVEPRALPEPTAIRDEEWLELTGGTEPYERPVQWPFREATAAANGEG